MNYLNKNGLSHLWAKLKEKLNNKADKSAIPTKTSQLTNDSSYTSSSSVTNFVVCTSAQYEASNKNSNTIYFITD